MKSSLPVIFLSLLCLTHQMMWLDYGINVQNKAPEAIISCCCEPGECSCEGHETTCGTMISSCFDASAAPSMYVTGERIKILPLEKAILKSKTNKKHIRKKREFSFFNKSNYVFNFHSDLFRPPRKHVSFRIYQF